jgi:hypothetical protein
MGNLLKYEVMEKLTYHLITGHTLEVFIETDELIAGPLTKKVNMYFCGMSVRFDMIKSLMMPADAKNLQDRLDYIEKYNDISARTFAN